MPAYDRKWFDPPAPLAYVVVRNPDSGATLPEVPMLLDSGADVSLVPVNVLDPLGLTAIPGKQYELISFDGGTSYAMVTRLEVLFCRRAFRGQFALIDQPWGVLGRNVLNAFRILLDGPSVAWEELTSGRGQPR